MSFSLDLLATLEMVARRGGISRAAEHLYVSQPTVTRQLQQLERTVKARLLQRVGRGVRLTREGEILVALSRRIAVLIAEAERDIENMQGLRSGRLSFGAGTSLSVHLLPAALVRFRERFSKIEVTVEAGNSEHLRDLLIRGEIDFALTEAMLPSPEFESSVFSLEELVAIVPTSHPLASCKSVAPRDLAGERFLARESQSETGTLVERVFRQAKLRIEPTMTFGSTEAVKHAVASGLGVSIVPRMSIGLEVAAKALAVISLKDVAMRRPIYLCRRTGNMARKPELAFLCILKHVVRGTLPKQKNTR